VAFAAQEDDSVSDHGYFFAVLAFEIDFKLPIGQPHGFIWVRREVQALSV